MWLCQHTSHCKYQKILTTILFPTKILLIHTVGNTPLLPLHTANLLHQTTPLRDLTTHTTQETLLRLSSQANLPHPPSQQHLRIPRLLSPRHLSPYLCHLSTPLSSNRYSLTCTPQPLLRRRSCRPRPPLRQDARLARNSYLNLR